MCYRHAFGYHDKCGIDSVPMVKEKERSKNGLVKYRMRETRLNQHSNPDVGNA